MLPKNGKSDLTSADLWFIFTDEQISQNARGSQVMVLILTEVGRIGGGQRLDEGPIRLSCRQESRWGRASLAVRSSELSDERIG